MVLLTMTMTTRMPATMTTRMAAMLSQMTKRRLHLGGQVSLAHLPIPALMKSGTSIGA